MKQFMFSLAGFIFLMVLVACGPKPETPTTPPAEPENVMSTDTATPDLQAPEEAASPETVEDQAPTADTAAVPSDLKTVVGISRAQVDADNNISVIGWVKSPVAIKYVQVRVETTPGSGYQPVGTAVPALQRPDVDNLEFFQSYPNPAVGFQIDTKLEPAMLNPQMGLIQVYDNDNQMILQQKFRIRIQ